MNNSWSSTEQEGINSRGGRDESETVLIKEVTLEQGLKE